MANRVRKCVNKSKSTIGCHRERVAGVSAREGEREKKIQCIRSPFESIINCFSVFVFNLVAYSELPRLFSFALIVFQKIRQFQFIFFAKIIRI